MRTAVPFAGAAANRLQLINWSGAALDRTLFSDKLCMYRQIQLHKAECLKPLRFVSAAYANSTRIDNVLCRTTLLSLPIHEHSFLGLSDFTFMFSVLYLIIIIA